MTDETTPHIDIYSTQDLLNLPPATWLMDQLIPEHGRIGLYGAPSGGKSFLALDWAMHISEGMKWLGRFATKQGPVVYIAAEGGRGIQKRVRAWMRHYQKTDLAAMYWLLEPLYVRDEGVIDEFIGQLEKSDIFPQMVVFDTLSRSMGNGDENGPDMAYFVDRVIHLASRRQMSALIVHHTNATGNRERGHTAFRANLDAMFSCKAERNSDGRLVRLAVENNKQKDDIEGGTLYLAPAESETGSLVFEETVAPEPAVKGAGEPTPMRRLDMVKVLGAAQNGMTWEEWRLACGGVPKATFSRRLKKLQLDGEIYRENGRFFVPLADGDLVDMEDEDEDEDEG